MSLLNISANDFLNVNCGISDEGTSNSLSRVTPSDQLDEGFHMRQLKKEQPEDDKYLCKPT